MRRSIGLVLLLAALLGGCPTTTTPNDAATGNDAAGEVDAGETDEDAAADVDAGADVDAAVDVDAAAEVDAASDVDAAVECHPAGTYVMTWTPDPSNPPGCPTFAPTTTVEDDGLDSSIRDVCGSPGCDATNCEVSPATSAGCTARVRVEAPCTALPGADGFLAVLEFHPDGTLEATGSLVIGSGTCTATGTGTLE